MYLGFYNSSMARVNYFHNANSYSSSLDSSMAELLNTLFQNYSHLVLLSHLYQKKSYSLITLTLSISLSLSHTLSSPSQSHCTLIARFLEVEKYTECVGASALVYLSIVLEYLAAEVTKHFGIFFGVLWDGNFRYWGFGFLVIWF